MAFRITRCPAPGHHRAVQEDDRRSYARAARGSVLAFRQLRRGLPVFQALAVPFPQHGPGKKHHRPIRLEAWQQALVEQATEEFIRGLIDSDGCRTVANDRGVRSVRYHFSNRSDDIRGLFCAALDRLGIPWTQNSTYQIAVYRKARHSATQRVRRPEVLTAFRTGRGTVMGCPLHGVGDPHWLCW